MTYKAVQQATLLADRQLAVLKEVARKKTAKTTTQGDVSMPTNLTDPTASMMTMGRLLELVARPGAVVEYRGATSDPNRAASTFDRYGIYLSVRLGLAASTWFVGQDYDGNSVVERVG